MAAYRRVYETHVTCRLTATAKNRYQLRDPTLGNRVWATFTDVLCQPMATPSRSLLPAMMSLLLLLADGVEKDVDDAKLLAVLHSLYSITFTPPGRDAVVTVMALDDNISILLPFVEMNGLSFC